MIEIFKKSLELIEGKFFLNNTNAIYSTGCKILTEAKKAIEYAQSQQLDGADDWAELQEKEDAKLRSFLYEANVKDSELFIFWSKTCKVILRSKLQPELQYALDEIIHDLYCIGVNNYFAQGTHSFYATLESVYKLGGWPCGWVGTYPEGSLVVYARNPGLVHTVCSS